MARAAIDHVLRLLPRPDLVLVTGDITETGTADAYRLARDLLSRLPMPVVVLPGNHDDREAFRTAFADHPYLPAAGPVHFTIDRYPVRLVALDCTVPGAHHGAIDADGLAWLEAALAAAPDRPTFVLTHHHPVPSGIGFLDAYANRSAGEIAAVLSGAPQVDRVLFGHAHRQMVARFGGTLAVGCPSTASQLALRLDPGASPASSMEPPAMLLHLWRAGGETVTHFCPIGVFEPPLAHA